MQWQSSPSPSSRAPLDTGQEDTELEGPQEQIAVAQSLIWGQQMFPGLGPGLPITCVPGVLASVAPTVRRMET